jgi:hypothetical protein
MMFLVARGVLLWDTATEKILLSAAIISTGLQTRPRITQGLPGIYNM